MIWVAYADREFVTDEKEFPGIRQSIDNVGIGPRIDLNCRDERIMPQCRDCMTPWARSVPPGDDDLAKLIHGEDWSKNMKRPSQDVYMDRFAYTNI